MSNTRRAAGAAPAQDAVFDLDAFEAEAERKPFQFTFGGTAFELPHGETLDWQSLASLDASELFLHALGDQREAFEALPLSTGGYKELQRRWFAHSGVSLGEGKPSSGS